MAAFIFLARRKEPLLRFTPLSKTGLPQHRCFSPGSFSFIAKVFPINIQIRSSLFKCVHVCKSVSIIIFWCWCISFLFIFEMFRVWIIILSLLYVQKGNTIHSNYVITGNTMWIYTINKNTVIMK